MDNPLAADRIPARFCAALLIFVKNALPHFAVKRSSNFVAKSAEENTENIAVMTDDQAELHAIHAEKAIWKSKKPPAHPSTSVSVLNRERRK